MTIVHLVHVKHNKQFQEVIQLAIICVRFLNLCSQSVRVFEQRFHLSFREVFEVQIYSWWDTRTQILFSEVEGLNNFK